MKYGIWLLIAICLTACQVDSSAHIIDLSDLEPLPTANSEIIPLRVSVGAVISPRGTIEGYRPLMDYLSAKLDRPVELVQRRTYVETNQLVQEQGVDLAFVCTSAYIIGHDTFGMELIAAPQVNNNPAYAALIIVPATSNIQSIADLRGKVFAFTDPISFTGRVYPTYMVQQLSSTPDFFFKRTFFTYSHDNAIHAVAEGLADGASVDSLVYDFALERDPSLAQKLRIIHHSPDFAIPPVVANPNIRPQLKVVLQEILFNMHLDPEGQKVLEGLGIERFVSIDDASYNAIRTLTETVGSLSE